MCLRVRLNSYQKIYIFRREHPRMKKGFEIQLNWIFILIAGAVILAFFFTLAQKQRVLSAERLSVQLSRDIDVVFTSAIAAKGVAQPLRIPGKSISFECTNACDCSFSVMNKPASFSDKIIFAPPALSGPSAVLWAVEWKLPFRVVNFLLLAQPGDRYIFVTGELRESRELQKKLSRELPAALQASFVSLGSLADEKRGNERVRVVFLGVLPVNLNTLGMDASFNSKDVSGLFIDTRTRKLSFYNWADEGFASREATYSGDAGLYAAIFSFEPLMYFCGIKKGLLRMAHVAEIYSERASVLGKEVGVRNPDCVYVVDALDILHQSADERTTSVFPDFPDLASLELVGQQLQQQNEALILQSCPEIY